MNSVMKLIESIEHCLLPKLARNFDESENHPEYDVRKNKVDQYFSFVMSLLGDLDLRQNALLAPSVLSSLLIMYKELQSDGPWNTEQCKTYSLKLNCGFGLLYEITLDNLLRKNNTFNTQDVFDKCIENLHRKLTSEEFKKYPGRIEVYCSLMQDVKEFDVKLNALKTLPISLLMAEDYIIEYKIKGLKCCITILQCLSKEDFDNGNYYEVIYRSLKKVLVEKDLEVTKLVLECFMEQMKIVPADGKVTQLDDLFKCILEHVHLEPNLLRKEQLLNFFTNIIDMHGVNCVSRKKTFMALICDSLDMCTIEMVADVLLLKVLECYKIWIQHCWCVWKLSTDQKVLSQLLKILYVCKDEDIAEKVQTLIIILIGLCTKPEQTQILNNLEKSSQLPSEKFLKRIDIIKNEISV